MTGIRTLWVTNDFPPRAGGIETFVGALAGLLDPAGVRVLTGRSPDGAAYDAGLAYPVDRIARRPLLPGPRLRAAVREAAREHRADVVVFGASWPLGEIARHLDVPTFALTHGHEAGMARVGLGPLVRRALRQLDGVGVISRFTRSALVRWAGGTPLHDLSPGVDTGRFHPGVDGSPIRARYGIASDQPLVVCVSRLVPRKGQDILVEAWPQVRSRVPGAHLLLAGSGPLADRLRRRVEAKGAQGGITLAGPVEEADVPAVHAAADLFAMPCRTRLAGLDVEGLGIVYLEAQATGTPVVAGRSGGAPETVVDGETGRIVDGTSAAAVAGVIGDLLTAPAQARTMGEAGRAFVERRYAWPVIGRRFEGILADIARARPPA